MTNHPELGTIVNDIAPDPEAEQLERDCVSLALSRINLRVSPHLFDSLLKKAEFFGITIEQYAEQILLESQEERIGKSVISGPKLISGIEVKKVTGPSFKKGEVI